MRFLETYFAVLAAIMTAFFLIVIAPQISWYHIAGFLSKLLFGAAPL